ncbi:MAG: hypothetical protein M1812_006970 [Candelaria pacifica]|nr:MAG: hypothetical protein M1812_006970 [Candelaria pacifica]
MQHQGLSGPVTALSFYESDETTLILAGEGPYLQVYEYPSSQLLLRERVFASHAVHGIAITDPPSLESHYSIFIVWGGSSIAAYALEITNGNPPRVRLRVCIPEIKAPDWVLDCSWAPCPTHKAPISKAPRQAFLITAHNVLLRLGLENKDDEDSDFLYSLTELSSNSRSVLYSAHVLVFSQSCILVAAGTVFGEILLWSCDLTYIGSPGYSQTSTSQLHRVFTGHEGSIFGVRLSHQVISPSISCGQYFLASCSDDRTIRVWNITNCFTNDNTISLSPYNDVLSHTTGFRTDLIIGSDGRNSPQCCVAVIWAHASRIWGVRFLQHRQENAGNSTSLNLLSWGEDATCQQWKIRLTDNDGNALHPTQCTHEATARLHSGKNIWSMGLLLSKRQYPLVSTGGADGRITVHGPTAFHNVAPQAPLRKEWDTGQILALFIQGVNGTSEIHNTEMKCPTGEVDNLQENDNKLCTPPMTLPPSKLASTVDSKAHFGDFKGYAFLDERCFIVSTSLGALIVGALPSLPRALRAAVGHPICGSSLDKGEVTWQVVGILEDLKKYSLVVSVSRMGVALVTGANGVIYSYHHSSGAVCRLMNVNRKISGLFTQYVSADHFSALAVCVGHSVASLYTLRYKDGLVQIESQYQVQLPPEFVPTSVLCLQRSRLVVLGARNGSLAFYGLPEMHLIHNDIAPTLAYFGRLHGEDGITVITNLSQSPASSTSLEQYFLTAGRDGKYSIHFLTSNRTTAGNVEDFRLVTVHTSYPPFGPNIEGAYVDDATHELVLYGFRGKDFVVWNESTHSEILTVECGGGNRSWAYAPCSGRGRGGSLVWTKASSLNVFRAPRASHTILQHGGHGREIKALAIFPTRRCRRSKDAQFLATGAEDTAIRIFDSNDGELMCVGIFKRHTTGVQHLQWSECGHFLFSCGGSEEFYVWRVRDVPVLGIGVVQEAACPSQSHVSDVRIMNFKVSRVDQLRSNDSTSPHHFLVSMVYSDSTIKVFRYSSSENKGHFEMLCQGSYASSCLTQVYHCFRDDKLCLFTAGTDGFIAYWSLDVNRTVTPIPRRKSSFTLSSQVRPPDSAAWLTRFRVHQSTVKSMSVETLSDRSLLIITGGDDNALSVTRFRFAEHGQGVIPAYSTIRVVNAHASTVTAITVLPSLRSMPSTDGGHARLRFATTSNDQRVKIWCVTVNLDRTDVRSMIIKREAIMHTSVADASSVGLLEDSGDVSKLVVCGVGMNILKMSKLE